MMATIKARPTTYKGIRMRSRLEASFAAYLDGLGAYWEYEPECFAAANGQWLPDFGVRFAGDDCCEAPVGEPCDGPLPHYIEVKPAGPLRAELASPMAAHIDYADKFLRQMTVAWASRPDAQLNLVFFDYAEKIYLQLFSEGPGRPWMAWNDGGMLLLWVGMGQLLRLADRESSRASRALAAVPDRRAAVLASLDRRWPDLAGPLADHTRPGGLTGSQFTILADSTAWATQARISASALRSTLNLAFGSEVVTTIKVRRAPGGLK
jgi:hypothetical protein